MTLAKLPLAGLLTLALVLAVDAVVLGVRGPWPALHQRVEGAVPKGIVNDRLQFRRLLDAPDSQRRAIVVGSSRANAGFNRPEARPDLIFGKIAHAGLGVFQIRSLADEALDFDTDVMAIVLSEFDLNSPVTINPQANFGSLSATRDLFAEVGTATSFEHRLTFYRLAMTALLNSYRFRRVLHSAFADDFRRFELDKRLSRKGSSSPLRPLVSGGQRKSLTSQDKERIKAEIQERFPHLTARAVRLVFQQIHRITRGPHFEIKAGLLRRAIKRLSEAGVKVVIAEAPVHPLAEEIYDPTIRMEFLTLASSLEKQFGTRFIPLESSGPFEPEEFKDLTHLNHRGARKLTRAILGVVDEVLE